MSAASIWEACIIAELARSIPASGFAELPVLALHALKVAALPPIHRDPFDRLLVAQAESAGLHLLSADAILGGYSPRVIAVPS